MPELSSFNAMVRKWADQQPAKYRKSALAFGYRCDRLTHSFTGTLQWVSKKSRERKGEGVSVSTLKRHLKAFKASGVITVENRRDGSRNMSSVYHVDFGKVVEVEADERDAWLTSLGELPAHSGYDVTTCPGCQVLTADYGEKMRVHLADGGERDPWAKA